MKSYICVILISALLLSTLFFALPKTENLLVLNQNRFDLNKKEDLYWKQEFIVELNIDPKDRAARQQIVNQTKNILYKRLAKVNVEEIQIVNHNFENEEKDENYLQDYLKITTQSTISNNIVGRLISSNGDIQIMIPNKDLDELSQEDQIQIYMPENYTSTEWSREKFRNILINDLRAGDGEKSYFGIFKPRFGNRSKFTQFLKENENKMVGVLMDSFVMPIEISPESTQLFAIGLGPDEGEAELQNIILNTGVIPVESLSIVSSQELEPQIYEIDHIQVVLAISVSILSLLFFLYQREEKEKILQLAFSLLLLFSIGLTILKIWQIPVDLFLLIPTGIFSTIFVKTMYTCTAEARFILLISIAFSILMLTLGTGYIPTLGRFFLFVILLSFFAEILTKTYFKNIKIINGNL